VLDEGRVDAERLDQDNAVAGLARIEFSQDSQALEQGYKRQIKLLKSYGNSELTRAFLVWINRNVLKRFRLNHPGDIGLENLAEVEHMITKRVETWAEKLMQQGEIKGILVGEVKPLKRQLARKFGTLPAEIESRIDGANEAQLDMWLDRVLDETTLEAVL
jgi:hypothetical protein